MVSFRAGSVSSCLAASVPKFLFDFPSCVIKCLHLVFVDNIIGTYNLYGLPVLYQSREPEQFSTSSALCNNVKVILKSF